MISAYLGLVAAREDCIDEASMTRDRLKSATCTPIRPIRNAGTYIASLLSPGLATSQWPFLNCTMQICAQNVLY